MKLLEDSCSQTSFSSASFSRTSSIKTPFTTAWFPAFVILLVALLLTFAGLSGVAKAQISEEIELEVWINEWTNETRRWWFTEFYPTWREEFPHVSIAIYWQNWGSFSEQLVTQTAGGVAPDVFQAGAEFVWEMAESGFAQGLNDRWADWELADGYFPMVLEAVTHKGTIYGVPVLAAPRTYLYRTDLLEESGFSAERLPTTWEEFRELAVRTTRGTDTEIEVLGTDLEWNFHKYLAFLFQNGGDMLTPDLTEPAFGEPPGIEALEFMVELNDAVVQGRTIRHGVGFRQGLVAAQYDSQHALRGIRAYRPEDLDRVAVGYPLKRVYQQTPVFTDWLAIHRHSDNADWAWEFIKFFSRPEHIARYNETLFFIPPHRYGVGEAHYLFELPQLLTFVDIVDKYARPVPTFPTPTRLADVINEAVLRAVEGEESALAALERAMLEFRNAIGRR